ncbi:MAG TPA: serine hydrolase [Gemmatimonadaceae bacterium]|nr:serine hydrolase [Gemmatimonadaceae bacterium]
MTIPSALNRDRAQSLPSDLDALRQRIEATARKSGARAVAVALHDIESGADLHYDADRWFHGASTIKVAILLAVYGEIDRGRLVPQSRLHVRNRFLSAYDGSPFRVLADRDADSAVHAAIGKTMRISELALHMIATSSNLATNLLLDLIGLETVQRTLDRFGLTGIDMRRGVEDEKAYEHGIVNRVTANGLVALLRLIAEERAYSPELSREMLDILHQQEFKKGIPARLPREVRVAHKTGDISTVAHDAGVVYAPDRQPYVIAILTEWAADAGSRSPTIATISHAVYDALRATPAVPNDA